MSKVEEKKGASPAAATPAKAECKKCEKPFITGLDPFVGTGEHGYPLFTDDYISKPLVLKLKTTNNEGTNLSYKSSLAKGDAGCSLSDEFKAYFQTSWLPEGSWIWARLKDNNVKLHVELPKYGFSTVGFGFNSDRSFKNWDVRAIYGLNTELFKEAHLNSAFRVAAGQSFTVLSHRHSLSYKHLRWGFACSGNVCEKEAMAPKLLREDALLGYVNKDWEAFLRTEGVWNKGGFQGIESFGNVYLELLGKRGKTKAGLQVKHSLSKKENLVTVGVESSDTGLKDLVVKGKVNNQLEAGLSCKFKPAKGVVVIGTITSKLNDLQKSTKWGTQVELAI